MPQFTVTRGGHTNSHLTDRPAKARTFDSYAAAEQHFVGQIERLRQNGYRIEYRRTLSDLAADLTAGDGRTIDTAVWRVSARRGVMRGRGLWFTLRSSELEESLAAPVEVEAS